MADPQDQQASCDICFSTFDDFHQVDTRRQGFTRKEFPVTTPCGHTLGAKCLSFWLKDHHSCPFCRANLTKYQVLSDPVEPRATLALCEYEDFMGIGQFKQRLLWTKGNSKGDTFELEGKRFVVPHDGDRRQLFYNEDKSVVLLSTAPRKDAKFFEVGHIKRFHSTFPGTITTNLISNSELWVLTYGGAAYGWISIKGRGLEVPRGACGVLLTPDGDFVRWVRQVLDWITGQ